MLISDAGERWHAAEVFVATGAVAIIAGGLLAAGVAHHPPQLLVWMSAYLVLIVGAAQIVFGAGQARLSPQVPQTRWIAVEWVVFNLGNAGVVAGTLLGWFAMVLAGTVLFAAGIALFLVGTRGAARGGWLAAYRILLGVILVSSLVGLGLSAANVH